MVCYNNILPYLKKIWNTPEFAELSRVVRMKPNDTHSLTQINSNMANVISDQFALNFCY